MRNEDSSSMKIDADVVTGVLRNTRKHGVLGPIAGLVLEANISTEDCSGVVIFILSKKALMYQTNPDPKEMN